LYDIFLAFRFPRGYSSNYREGFSPSDWKNGIFRFHSMDGANNESRMIESLGPKLRKQRRRLGLTLDELAGRTGISKPYLSLIETSRVPNPPSDEKLRRLEQALGFASGELLTQAHLHRTPRDVRAVLQKLIKQGSGFRSEGSGFRVQGSVNEGSGSSVNPEPRTLNPTSPLNPSIDPDDAYLSGILHEMADKGSTNVEHISAGAVPVINRVSAGYPKDFTDLSYPKGIADDYVACPGVDDKDAFAARVHGDSMSPKYREGDIVIFSPAAVPRNGDDCFVRFEHGGTTFKRVFYESNEKSEPVIRLQPRNEKYRPQIIPSEQITGIYRAVFRYQRVDDE
jgi:phage repressor protein C with HTH and peptisase S24 domain/transcriptional regulator with XRE-family HTH domain